MTFCQHLIIEIIRMLSAAAIAVGAAFIGFRYACKRDDRATIKSAEIRVVSWRKRIMNTPSFVDTCALYAESIADLDELIDKASALSAPKKKTAIENAWNDYRALGPDKMRPRIPTDPFPRYEAESELAEDAIERTTAKLLEVLQDAASV
jgi:hypothetical protein